MIEQALRTFCESRFRWLIVTAGTFIVGLVLVLPLVDVYSAEREEKAALLAELESADQVAKTIEQFETRAAEKSAQLATLESHTVDDQSLPALRNRLVELARETGCSLRRLNVGTKSSRPWYDGDDPVATSAVAGAKRTGKKTSFDLEWWPISVSLSGTNANLRSLVERLEADGSLMHTKVFEMHPASVGRETVALDVELWYFNLARGG
jgi:hypothetical protein